MRLIFRSRPVPTEETHRTTAFEVFFDLVFVFAFTQVIMFMAQAPTARDLWRGLVLLMLLWWPYTTFAWLANQVRADVGLVRAGLTVVMGAVFVGALVLPYTWPGPNGPVDNAPLTLALAYIVVRAIFLGLSVHISAENPRLRAHTLLLIAPTLLGWIPLLLGVPAGNGERAVLWAAAVVIDIGGARIVEEYGPRGIQVPSPSHMADRHAIVLIIALGISLSTMDNGALRQVTRWPVWIAALLGLSTTVCLWWLYFENTAEAATRAMVRIHDPHRAITASKAYGLTHFLLVAGVIYLTLGVEQAVAHVGRDPHTGTLGAPLNWTTTTALYGGGVVYLGGRILFVRLTVRHTPPAPFVAACAILVLLPISRGTPAMIALALLAGVFITLVCYERYTWEPTAAVR